MERDYAVSYCAKRMSLRQRRGPGTGVEFARPLAVAVAAALMFFACADLGRAGATTTTDGDDVVGALDVQSVSQGHAPGKVVHTIRTYGNWPVRILGPSRPNYLLFEFSTDADAAPERSVIVVSRSGRLIALIFGPNGRFIASAGVSRPNRHSVRVTVPLVRLGRPAGYRWQAFAFYKSTNACRHGCFDHAPNGATRILHDLRKPRIVFPQPPAPTAPSTEYDVNFSVSDAGGSGVASWSLQHRVVGDPPTWNTVASNPDPKTWHQVSDTGDQDQFRVVARDGHGNTTVSPVRTVSVP